MIFLGENGIARATTHEVAHQWFYSLVGNDQGRDPVLDGGSPPTPGPSSIASGPTSAASPIRVGCGR